MKDECCAFCGKSPKEVKTMVTGPKVNICDECVGICVEIVAGRSEAYKKKPEENPTVKSALRFRLPAPRIRRRIPHFLPRLPGEPTIEDLEGFDPSRVGDRAPRRQDRPHGIGQLLVEKELITLTQLEQVIAYTVAKDVSFFRALAELDLVPENKLTAFLSEQYGCPTVGLASITISSELVKLVPREVCELHSIFPVDVQGMTIVMAMADPSNIYALDDVKFLTGYNTEAVIATEAQIKSAIERHYLIDG